MHPRFTLIVLALAASVVGCRKDQRQGRDRVEQAPATSGSIEGAADAPIPSGSAVVPSVPTFRYEETTLRGKLTEQLYYGPPGYGDDPSHDDKEWVYLLVLPEPIDILRREGDPEWNVDRVAVTKVSLADTKDPKLDLKALVNKNVTIKGGLMGAHTAHHHTDVMMTGAEVTPD